ncbi:MAG: serine acetyltransferase, partial [Abditibacteriota bacterium]|nr:serine acetyltransferase [Abditibacteriota bacterium]
MGRQVIASRDMGEYIRSDCFRYMGSCSGTALLKCYLTNKAFRWQVAFRLCHGSGLVKLAGYFLWYVNQTRHQIQISIYASCGYGLYIGHAGPVTVNRTAVLGNNCSLSQFTTIGSNHNNAAVVGDNVYI